MIKSIKKPVSLRFQKDLFIVFADFDLICEIEKELGSVASLLERFSKNDWKISELVSLTHMMLQAAGKTVDYKFLGNMMLKEGLSKYLSSARSLLQLAMKA